MADKKVRIATQSISKEQSLSEKKEQWDKLKNALSDYPVVIVDFDDLMAGKTDTGAQADDITMFKFGSHILYSDELTDKKDLWYVGYDRELSGNEMLKICGIDSLDNL